MPKASEYSSGIRQPQTSSDTQLRRRSNCTSRIWFPSTSKTSIGRESPATPRPATDPTSIRLGCSSCPPYGRAARRSTSNCRLVLEEPVPMDLAPDEQVERFYRHGYLAECNDAMARMYGYARAEEIVGARLGDLLPSSIPENVQYLKDFGRSGYRLADTESQEVDRHGDTKYFLNCLTGIVENGSLMRAWGTQRDITERKQAEEELRESEERFRGTFEQATVGIAHVATDGHWLRVNRRLCDIVGYEKEELLGLTFQDITHPDDLETDLEGARRLLAGEIETYS